MSENTVIQFRRPAEAEPVGPSDPLTDLLRDGARRLIKEALEIEVEGFLAHYRDQRLVGGQQAVVRNGFQPERELQTGIGPVAVRVPKVRDRSGSGVKFNSLLVPPYSGRPRVSTSCFLGSISKVYPQAISKRR